MLVLMDVSRDPVHVERVYAECGNPLRRPIAQTLKSPVFFRERIAALNEFVSVPDFVPKK